MLSPNTPPGTLVVCINAGAMLNSHGIVQASSELVKGRVYTLDKINFYTNTKWGDYYVVHVLEAKAVAPFSGFNPARFKPAVLPSVLTDCLVVEKIPASIKKELVSS